MATSDTVAAEIHSGDLVWTLVRTDFKSRYHGTLGGFVWALLKPFTMSRADDGVLLRLRLRSPYNLHLIVGVFVLDFFGESTRAGLVSLYAKGYLLTKSQLPALGSSS